MAAASQPQLLDTTLKASDRNALLNGLEHSVSNFTDSGWLVV